MKELLVKAPILRLRDPRLIVLSGFIDDSVSLPFWSRFVWSSGINHELPASNGVSIEHLNSFFDGHGLFHLDETEPVRPAGSAVSGDLYR